MKALLIKELRSVFCSPVGAFFALAYLLVIGLILWFFEGKFNIIDRSYANMDSFFYLSPIFFLVLIPALTMRSFAEEKREKTLDILFARPVPLTTIYLSKFLSLLIFVTTILLSTFTYIYTLYSLSNPIGNIDLSCILASYLSLVFLAAVFISIGLLCSSLTKNQLIGLVMSLFICLFVFYGFDLLSEIAGIGKTQIAIASLGLNYHYQAIQRGVISLSDAFCVFNYIFIFILLTHVSLSKRFSKRYIYCALVLVCLNILLLFVPHKQIDITSDERYTLSDYTQELLARVGETKDLKINVYLDGNLNYGFQHLKESTDQLLGEFNRYAGGRLAIQFINPYQLDESPKKVYEQMSSKGMDGILLNQIDREGKSSQQMIYPFAEVSSGENSLIVPLLKNIHQNTADENINLSIENLEFAFTDAIRLLNQTKPKTIAFIEGHGELDRAYVYDAEELLSKYYFVNRGTLGSEIGILDNFDAVIIAGPLQKYSEREKYILDQYVMQGGRVLWLIDGVHYSSDDLKEKGYSASMKNELNLDDLLFTYGIRINPDLVQDTQCISTLVIANDVAQSKIILPSYFQPLLMPSQNHVVTKNIRDIKAGFVSSISVVNSSSDIKKTVLLTTSANAHLLKVPDVIDFDVQRIEADKGYFNEPFIPISLGLEGVFPSVFANRVTPDSLDLKGTQPLTKSHRTKMVVVASSDIISNEIQGTGANSQVLPMGYDRISGQQYGNRDFIVNAMNWLTDDDGLMLLRNKQQAIRLLNKKESYDKRNTYAILNIAMPLALVFLIMGGVTFYRKRKYENS